MKLWAIVLGLVGIAYSIVTLLGLIPMLAGRKSNIIAGVVGVALLLYGLIGD